MPLRRLAWSEDPELPRSWRKCSSVHRCQPGPSRRDWYVGSTRHAERAPTPVPVRLAMYPSLLGIECGLPPTDGIGRLIPENRPDSASRSRDGLEGIWCRDTGNKSSSQLISPTQRELLERADVLPQPRVHRSDLPSAEPQAGDWRSFQPRTHRYRREGRRRLNGRPTVP
jgi:hypothetical protein